MHVTNNDDHLAPSPAVDSSEKDIIKVDDNVEEVNESSEA